MILVAAPISQVKDYCMDDWLACINELEGDYEIYLVDNTKGTKYQKKILEKGINCDHVEPEGSPVEYITHSQNVIRHKFLQGNYTHLMSIECDVFAPKNIIPYLLHYDLPVVSGNYWLGEYSNLTLSIQEMDNFRGYAKTERISFDECFYYSGLRRVFMTHLGLTLIDRSVMQAIEFRDRAGERENVNASVFSDTYFGIDCMKHGIPIHVDMDLYCEHRRSNWNENKNLING